MKNLNVNLTKFDLVNENSTGAIEDIDFSEEMVVAVFMEEKPTAGYSIEIKDVLKKRDHLEFLINSVRTCNHPYLFK